MAAAVSRNRVAISPCSGSFRPTSPAAQSRKEPEEQSHDQQELPAPPEVEILPSLVAKPEPPLSQKIMDPQELPQKATPDHQGQGPEQKIDSPDLPTAFALTQGRGQHQTAADVGGDDPEKGQLQMPGTQNIAGKDLVEVKAEETSRFGPVVADSGADERLGQKEHSDDNKKFDGQPAGWP